jgi:PHP domain
VHDHNHHHGDTPEYADLSVPERELRPLDVSRRRFLRNAGLLGATVAGAGALSAGTAASTPTGATPGWDGPGRYQWLSGDHHIHTQYSNDAMYTVEQQVAGGVRNGLDWMVITDHGYLAHEKYAVQQTYADVLKARQKHRGLLLWQGLEWNTPAAEHSTIFFDCTHDEAQMLQTFERLFDGNVNGTNPSSPANELIAVQGLRWLDAQVRAGKINSALFLANHPSRNGRLSPHELRNWRDAAPHIAVGMEGSPGAQADSTPTALGGNGALRGGYSNSPGADSWPGYPLELYRTHGGFDWMTAKLGGLWDSMLAEGQGWWITSNSDSHRNFGDTLTSPSPDADYSTTGKHLDPVDSGVRHSWADFWPGQYSRTVVGATDRSYRAVMDGIRNGRVWVAMGGLLAGLEVTVFSDEGGWPVTLGGRTTVRRGGNVTILVVARLATRPNTGGSVPKLARMDLIQGQVTGPVADRDTFTTPNVRVVQSFETRHGFVPVAVFQHTFRNVRDPFYLRLRGTDGNFHATGSLEPRMDPAGGVDPWSDLWTYSNPVFVDVC